MSLICLRPEFACGLILVGAVMFSGCSYFYDNYGEEKRLPAPIATDFPFEFKGKLYRVWSGSQIQIKSDMHTAYIELAGVDYPKTEEQNRQAVEHLQHLLNRPDVVARVIACDERKRFIAQVFCGGQHINLAMIRDGWGTYDQSEFAESEKFAQAEKSAMREGVGVWGQK